LIQFAEASPRGKIAIAAGVVFLALIVVAAVAVLFALFGLNQISGTMRWSQVPRFFWYYRGDPLIHTWLGRGAMIGGLVVVLSLLVILRRGVSLHGAARFASEREIRKEGLRADTGIILGRKGGRYLVFGGSEHVLLEAPTRGGKGVGVVIPNLLNWRDSVVVLDVKRENWDITAGFRKDSGQDVYLFDPLDVDRRTARYNPLSYIRRDDAIEVINELQKISVMLFPAPERGDPFWTEASRVGFVGVGAYVAATVALPFTVGEIYRNLTNGDPKNRFPKLIAERAAAGDPLSVGCVSALADFTSASDNTFSSIKQTITSRLNLWLNPYVDAATAGTDFDLREIRKRRMTIYLGVSPDNIDRVAPLYNLFFQQLVDLNTRDLPENGGGRIQVLVLLDEFARLGRAGVIASGFSYVAGYGLRLLPVIQSRAQLRAIYGNDVADEIVANCGVEIAFTPKELRVANELSERLGYYTTKATSKSRSIHGMLANRSQSESDHRRALMLPQELMQMPKGQLLVLRGGIPVIKATKIFYFKARDFRSRVRPAPAFDSLPLPSPADLPADPLDSSDDPVPFAPEQLAEERAVTLDMLVRKPAAAAAGAKLSEDEAEAAMDQYWKQVGLSRAA
jgi:type IV secretion system protein VirD4